MLDDPVPGGGGDGLLEGGGDQARAGGEASLLGRDDGYNASPVFFTMCVLLLGAHTAQHRPVVGSAAVLGALLIYTFRATILQTRLRQVQESLNDSERNLRVEQPTA